MLLAERTRHFRRCSGKVWIGTVSVEISVYPSVTVRLCVPVVMVGWRVVGVYGIKGIHRELMGQIMWLSFGPISTGHSRRHDHRHHRHDWRHRQNCSPVVEMVDVLIRSALQTRWVLSRAAGNFGPRLDWLALGFRVARGWRRPSELPGAGRVIFLHSFPVVAAGSASSWCFVFYPYNACFETTLVSPSGLAQSFLLTVLSWGHPGGGWHCNMFAECAAVFR